jgi:hypothetical protein
MRVFINRRVVVGPYGGGNLFVKAFFDFAPEFGIEPTNVLDSSVNAILMIDPRPDDLGISFYEISRFARANSSVKIIQRINECDARKGTNEIDKLLSFCSMQVHKTIFVSKWLEDYHKLKGWFCRSTGVIYNGVDHQHFRPNVTQSDVIRIVSHHWSNNEKKGFDVYEWLDQFVVTNPSFTFTYIGRERGTFKNTRIVAPLFGQALGDELAKHDVYVSGSRFDPGPNHIIEAIACGLPTYAHVDGGGAVEFAGDDHTFDSIQMLEALLLRKQFSPNSVQFCDWRECIRRYCDAIIRT